MQESHYSTPDMSRIAGIPERKVLSYIERGFIRPSIQEADGPGTKRKWSFEDLVRCSVITMLSTLITVDALRLIAKWMEDDKVVGRNMLWKIHIAKSTGELVFYCQSSDDEEFLMESVVKPIMGVSKGSLVETTISRDKRVLNETPIQIQIDLALTHKWIEEQL